VWNKTHLLINNFLDYVLLPRHRKVTDGEKIASVDHATCHSIRKIAIQGRKEGSSFCDLGLGMKASWHQPD